MKLLVLTVIAAVLIYFGMQKPKQVDDETNTSSSKDQNSLVESGEKSRPPLVEGDKKEAHKTELLIETESKVSSVEPPPKKASLERRPSFYIKHKGIKPQDCNLAYKEHDEIIIPTDMRIHDYFKWNDNQFYFAVSTNNRRFLLKATAIVKDKCKQEDIDLAFKFAKYCRAKDQPKPQVTAKPTVSETKDEWALSSKEEAHIKSSIKTLSLKADHFRQSGNVLKIYEDYKRDRRKETLEKVTGTYYLLEGRIPETYKVATRTGYTTKTVRAATLWSSRTHNGKRAYCTSFEMAYYHALCEYFETVKRKFYKGPKPTAPRTRNYQ